VRDGPALNLCRQDNSSIGLPYECVVSEVSLVGLLDSSLAPTAATPSAGLCYQVREFIQAIAERGAAMVIASCDDRSCTVSRKSPLDVRYDVLSLGASLRKLKTSTRGREVRIDVAAALGVRRSMTTWSDMVEL
jgi:hypothetical protein